MKKIIYIFSILFIFINAVYSSENYFDEDIFKSYSNMSNYTDKGNITVEFYSDGVLSRTKRIVFTTKIDSYDNFELTWFEEIPYIEGIISRIKKTNDSMTYEFGELDEELTIEEFDSLETLITATTGVSNRLTAIVPCLMIDEVDCYLSNGKYELQLCGEEIIDERKMLIYKIERDGEVNRTDKIWIDKTTKLIRRIEWTRKHKNSEFYNTIDYIDVKGNEIKY